ncbi:MAG: sigma-E factor negative regulatory protein [Rhodoferax sp.]|nr:sigma-E factor negative regulatory protein [Rhodoferax sp.]MDP3650615.1 sigma-E factor negative regulatory protein [Rhodoferax sp.]
MKEANFLSAERISALTDGQLEGAQFVQAVTDVSLDPDSAQTWLAYHVVGDVLRSPELAPSGRDLAFLDRFTQRLALEVEQRPVGKEGQVPEDSLGVERACVPLVAVSPSANESVFHWKTWAAVASVVVSAVLGLWDQSTIQNTGRLSMVPARATQTPLLAVEVAETGVMVRDPRLDELLLAHQQLAGHSALQMPAGFLRNATYEGPTR